MNRRARKYAPGAVLALFAASCEQPRTEIVVRVESEVPWGAGEMLQSVVLTVRRGGPTGPLRSAHTMALGEGGERRPLPLLVGVIATDNDVETPVWIEALGCGAPNGCAAGEAAVTQRAAVRFVREQTLELTMLLASACVGIECPGEQRCATSNGRCEAATNAQVEARPYVGPVRSARDDGAVAVDAPADGVSDAVAPIDEGRDDAATDAGVDGSSTVDDGPLDGGPAKADAPDVNTADTERVDVGIMDASAPDDGGADAGVADLGRPDSGAADAGAIDTGPRDVGVPDGDAACVPSTEIFNSRDDDCDGAVDEGFTSNGVSLACTMNFPTLPDGDIDDGAPATSNGLESYCLRGILRFCLTGEACPWRGGATTTDDLRTCSPAGLVGPSYFMAYYIRGYFTSGTGRYDEWYCPPDGRLRLGLR